LQSVSADLATAILAQERRPVVRLRIDWARDGNYSGTSDDLSADVISVDLDRDLTTDLPPQAKLFSGSAAASATITLASRDPGGDPAKHGAWKYSPLNSSSPLFGVRRKGAPALLEFGFHTASGVEYVTQLVGSVRSLQVTSGGRVAVMRIADRSETMRKQVQLPMVIADGESSGGDLLRPGLNTTFLADWVARKCGYYASPPPRSGCKHSATHHGSGYPEVGSLQHHHGQFGSKIAYSPTPTFPTAAKWVQAANFNGDSGQEVTYILGGATTTSTNNGGELLFEGWFKFNTTAADQPLFIAYITGLPDPFVSAFWQASTGEFTVAFNRGGADVPHSTGTLGPNVSPGTSWHYWAVQVGFNSTGADVTFRYDATTTGPVHVATGSISGVGALNTVGIGRGKISSFASGYLDALAEATQLTSESTTTLWNNAYAPTAQIVASPLIDNRLEATPVVTEEGWDLFQQIAASEFATAGFTETGQLFYWPRDRWTSPPYTISQRTLAAATSLKELESVEAIDQVRNRVVLRTQAPQVLDSGDVWLLATAVQILGSGATKTIIAELDRPSANIDPTFVSSESSAAGSRYLAGTRKDGLGLAIQNLTIVTTVLGPTTVKLAITNPGANGWLTGDAGLTTTYAGKPYLVIEGQPVEFDQSGQTRVEASSTTSIANYGEQLLELDDNDFRQDDDDSQRIVDDLRNQLAEPGPALADVPVVGDPRLQLGDRVTIVDPEGLVFTADFHLARIATSLDEGGFSQTLGLRSA
jgi:hypothetical protein